MTDKAPDRAQIGDSCTHILINSLRSEGKRLSVCLDGVELDRVVEYDVIQGYAVKFKMDKDGRVCASNGYIEHERIQGNITAHIVPLQPGE